MAKSNKPKSRKNSKNNRIWHFTYILPDAVLCGFFRLTKLPVASTFWRCLDSLGINQTQSL